MFILTTHLTPIHLRPPKSCSSKGLFLDIHDSRHSLWWGSVEERMCDCANISLGLFCVTMQMTAARLRFVLGWHSRSPNIDCDSSPTLSISTQLASVWTPFVVRKAKIEPNSRLCERGLRIGFFFFFQREEIWVFSWKFIGLGIYILHVFGQF